MAGSRPHGMAAFTLIWFGQLISLVGSAMSGFALTIYAWQISNNSATALALVGFFSFAPQVLFSPVAGALVDRWNRKLVLILSDLAAGLMTILILILNAFGVLQIWHLIVTGFIAGTFQAFQFPAQSAAITLMIPKEHYTRASGMLSLIEWGSGIFAPVLAGALLGIIGLTGILLIDVVTFIFAIGTVLLVTIPQPKETEEGRSARGSLLQESLYGFKYIWTRKSLFYLQLIFFVGNFFAAFGFTVFAPMILSRTANNALILGSTNSAAALGGVVGGLLITAWGGPKKKIFGVLWGWLFSGLIGMVLVGVGQSLPIWLIGSFFGSFFGPIINSSNQAIWMSKVAPDIQGKVFSVRRLIAQISSPAAMLMAGPFADFVFEPSLKTPQGALSGIFSWLTGIGPGAGMALMMIFSGLMIVVFSVGGFLNPLVRDVETIMPDHKAEILENT